jgi:hypothetical protein
MLVPAVVCLLLCGIAAAEMPELLSLNDNTSNDFTIRKANSLVFSVLQVAGTLRLVASDFKNPARVAHELHSITFEKTELISSDLLIFHSVLRT